MDKTAVSVKVRELCAQNGVMPLFATLFGSNLYGTALPGKSDLDVRGIFMPSLNSLILDQAPESLHYSTGNDNSRNHSTDLDIDLYSLQNWLLKQLPAGETGAMDLLFSPSNQDCAIFMDPRLDPVFKNPRRLVNIHGEKGYRAYCLRQAKKYGVRGSRLGALKRVHAWLLANCGPEREKDRLASWLAPILAHCGHEQYCRLVDSKNEQMLQICGKQFPLNTTMAEVSRRIHAAYERQGDSARKAGEDMGIDYKALSHAMRALDQMEELLATGKIVYPLQTRQKLIEIKKGKIPWKDYEPLLLARQEEIDSLCAKPKIALSYDKKFAEKIILDCYGEN